MRYSDFLKKIINKFISKFKKKKNLIDYIKEQNIIKFLKYYKNTKSQLGQDLFVLDRLNFANKGFFGLFDVTSVLFGLFFSIWFIELRDPKLVLVFILLEIVLLLLLVVVSGIKSLSNLPIK